MSNTAIEWTEETWNPIAGCSVHTPGCTNCYAMKMAYRLTAIAESGNAGLDHYRGTTRMVNGNPVWTGKIGIAPDSTLTKPLRWKKPRRIFVNSMSDLFHPEVSDEVIDRVFAVMALCPQHTFQVLTKRSARMREYLSGPIGLDEKHLRRALWRGAIPASHEKQLTTVPFPLPNVHLGVSVEDQARADQRIPDLLATPAAVRWISAEPLLGPLDLRAIKFRSPVLGEGTSDVLDHEIATGIDWVVCGGESGKNARPMHPDWARSLRDQCAESQVPFFFKQWGEWAPNKVTTMLDPARAGQLVGSTIVSSTNPKQVGKRLFYAIPSDATSRCGQVERMTRIGKRAAGRLLDGVLHDGFPA